ncbi:aldo keto reductase [Fusarium denticulatum]|uniref:Aldo keto reductase n=1 Tax=Fusarium denticulatum TaxID=48507 RepID=A0A8H5TZS0_9HYPO|nr:aldo keto reductase [Fusarium denticulatum]
MEYSPFSLQIDSSQFKLLKTARKLSVAVVAYSPLGRGESPKDLAFMDKIQDIANAEGGTASQLTLAWLLAQGDEIFPISTTTRPERLVENLASCMVELSDDEKIAVSKEVEHAEVIS